MNEDQLPNLCATCGVAFAEYTYCYQCRKKYKHELALERMRKHRARKKTERIKICIDCKTPINKKSRKMRCDECSKIHSQLVKDNKEFYKKTDRDEEIEMLKREIKRLRGRIYLYKKQKNLTPEQKEKDNARIRERSKRYTKRLRYYRKTEGYRKVRVASLDAYLKKDYNGQTDIIFKSQAHRSMYGELTRLMYDTKLPRECDICGSTQKLKIHHKQYCYPILLEHLQRLCEVHHDHSHHPESISLSKAEKNKMRARHNRLLKHIKQCQLCGADGTTDRGRLQVHHYKYDDNPESYIKVCRACHHRRLHHNDARQQHTEEVINILKRNIDKEVVSLN